jgi:hypothetical protein
MTLVITLRKEVVDYVEAQVILNWLKSKLASKPEVAYTAFLTETLEVHDGV